MSGHSHFDGAGGGEPVGPGQAIGGPIDVFLRLIGVTTGFPKDSAGDMAPEIHPIHGRPRGFEADATGRCGRQRYAERTKLLVQHLFQAARAGCKKTVFCAIHALSLLHRYGGHEVLRRMRKIRLSKSPSRR